MVRVKASKKREKRTKRVKRDKRKRGGTRHKSKRITTRGMSSKRIHGRKNSRKRINSKKRGGMRKFKGKKGKKKGNAAAPLKSMRDTVYDIGDAERNGLLDTTSDITQTVYDIEDAEKKGLLETTPEITQQRWAEGSGLPHEIFSKSLNILLPPDPKRAAAEMPTFYLNPTRDEIETLEHCVDMLTTLTVRHVSPQYQDFDGHAQNFIKIFDMALQEVEEIMRIPENTSDRIERAGVLFRTIVKQIGENRMERQLIENELCFLQ